MYDTLISFETAKLAKEKGFDIPTFAMMIQEHGFVINAANSIDYPNESAYDWNSRKGYSLPTQSLLQKWLREKHNTHILIDDSNGVLNQTHFRYQISELHKNNIYKTSSSAFNFEDNREGMYKTYEEALEQGLIEALKLL